ncbi:MAG: hypothetical protein ACYCV7_16945, partial [Acidimicrobiales bacterium]
GMGIAVMAVVTSLPAPAAGGTCGPGRSSETPLAAFFDPGSIGAGPRPSTANAAAYDQWLAFVGECQSSTDARMLDGLALLVLSLGAAGVGLAVSRRRDRDHKPPGTNADPTPVAVAVAPAGAFLPAGPPWSGVTPPQSAGTPSAVTPSSGWSPTG